MLKTVRLDHLKATLLAAAAGLLAAAGLVVVLYAQPAEANYPGKPGKIDYAGNDGNDSEIFTINVGGGGKLQLTDNTTSDYYADYAPNGKRIAYTNYAGTGTDEEIYTINLDGGDKRPVTDNATNDYDPYCGRQ
jgi:hypothetical protein